MEEDIDTATDNSSYNEDSEGNDDEQPKETTEQPPQQDNPIIILCLGDSVTSGYPYQGSNSTYPARVQSLLDTNTGQGNYLIINKGVGGYRADQVLANTSGWLNLYQPDIDLLMVGGNDIKQEATSENFLSVINQTVNEVQQIVNLIKSHSNANGSHPKVILSAFIPNQEEGILGSAAIQLYNNGLAGVTGRDIYFTDNWNDLYDTTTGQAKTSLMYDALHPNYSGYAVIAQNWYGKILLF